MQDGSIAPGVYENVSFEDYLSWPFVSNSSLGAAARSMLHYKSRQPIEETVAMKFGTLCHLGRLEPSAVFRRYVVMPDLTAGIKTKGGEASKNPKATAEYGERVDRWLLENADGKIVVTQEEFDSMVAVVAALDADPLAHAWFTDAGPVELSIVWDDPDTGLRCKGRIDKLAHTHQIITDLKTTRDCLRFPAQIAERNYHRQGAMYTDGYMVLTGEVLRFGLVAVENASPFGVMSAPVSSADIEAGREEYKELLAKVAESQRTGVWPGYSAPAEWTRPPWARARETESVTLTIGGERISL